MPKKKYPRDPNAPKKPTRPFLLYMMEVYKEVKEELGGGEGTKSLSPNVSKECARRWGLLGVEEKEKYNEMYRQDKAKYEETMKDYKPSLEFIERKRLAQLHNTTVKQPDITTVPQMIRSYFDYVGQTWANVSASLPRLDPDQVQEEIWRRWTEGEPRGRVDQNMNKVKKNKVKKSIKKNPDSPKAPRLAFNLFLNTMKEELMKALPGLPYTALVSNVASKWKVMTEEEKQPFFKLEREDKERFEKEVRDKLDAENPSDNVLETGSCSQSKENLQVANNFPVENSIGVIDNGRIDSVQDNCENGNNFAVATSGLQSSISEDESSVSEGEENGMVIKQDVKLSSSSSSSSDDDDDEDSTSDSEI